MYCLVCCQWDGGDCVTECVCEWWSKHACMGVVVYVFNCLWRTKNEI